MAPTSDLRTEHFSPISFYHASKVTTSTQLVKSRDESTQTNKGNRMSFQIDDCYSSSETQGNTTLPLIHCLTKLFVPDNSTVLTLQRNQGTQTPKDPLAVETASLAFNIVYDHAWGGGSSKLKQQKMKCDGFVVECLRRNCNRMLEKHALVFNGMMTRLTITPESDLKAGFNLAAEELFRGTDEVSWAKIIALFAFGARLARHVHERGMDGLVEDIAYTLSEYAIEKLVPFLHANGGWSTICEAFPHEDGYGKIIWQSLLATGFGLAIIASFLMIHNRQ